jgi:branched-chain amino acid transport system permease protein
MMSAAQQSLLAPSRWRPWEIAAVGWCSGPCRWCWAHAALINEIAILALFALSLDLILGLRRHRVAGPRGVLRPRRLRAALFAKHVMPDPLVGLLVAMAAGPCWAC